MVKAYLRYEPATTIGVIASTDSNITYDSSGKHLLSPALESVGVWHVRQGVCTKTLTPTSSFPGPSLAVTSVASSPSSQMAASGYADGSIRIWDCDGGTCEITLNGHKGAISALRYNKHGSLLASGSKEGDIILWDVVAETGLFRLHRHHGQVTDLVFLDSDKKLVSSSKDKFMRVWDLETQHCMQIISGHHSEIWSIDTDPNERYLVSGSSDPEIRVYMIKHELLDGQPASAINGTESGPATLNSKWEVVKYFGDIRREDKHRVSMVRFNKSGSLLACQVAGKTVEIFRVLDEVEAKRKAKRRIRRKKENKSTNLTAKPTDDKGLPDEMREGTNVPIISVPDVFKLLQIARFNHNICSFSFCPVLPKSLIAIMALSFKNNLLEIYSIESDTAKKTLSIELQGHRSAIRSTTLSSDNTLLMSTSHNAVKIWNPSTGSCLRTIDSAFGLCSLFGPRNKFAIIGTKGGKLEIIDVGSGTIIEDHADDDDRKKHHSDSVQSMAWIPNSDGFVTGSLDHILMFWNFNSGEGLRCTRYKDMENGISVIAVSPDAKYVAVALLDSTVKVLFIDSLKIYLSLYGHRLPVLCMDISSDGDLIVTGSIDKNLKIWGLDFGDCHKSIFAHTESVVAVRFVPNTHYVFSAGKDRLVKYWDADKFELLLTLEGHHAEIECLAVSNRGDFIVTGSQDRSIRRWDRTEEPFFIEEENEKRLEEMFESDLDGAFENKYASKDEIPEEGTVALAGKRTRETLTATDSIIDALDLAEAESLRISEYQEEKRGEVADFQPNSFMLGLSPSEFVIRALSNVRTNDLEPTLLALPFSDALKLMSYLKDWSSKPDKVEVVCRVLAMLLQTHHNQLVCTPAARPVLILLNEVIHPKIQESKDTFGFNLAAMDHLKQLMALKSDAPFRNAKSKLLEIRSKLAKRAADPGAMEQKRKKKKRKKRKKSDAQA